MDTRKRVYLRFLYINDLTGYEMPIYIADYVLMGFGTEFSGYAWARPP